MEEGAGHQEKASGFSSVTKNDDLDALFQDFEPASTAASSKESKKTDDFDALFQDFEPSQRTSAGTKNRGKSEDFDALFQDFEPTGAPVSSSGTGKTDDLDALFQDFESVGVASVGGGFANAAGGRKKSEEEIDRFWEELTGIGDGGGPQAT